MTALRWLLRFLHVEGVIDRPLAEAVPRLASWNLAGLPKAISAQQRVHVKVWHLNRVRLFLRELVVLCFA